MSEFLNAVVRSVDERNRDTSTATRRQLVAGATAALGTMGALSWAREAEAALPSGRSTAPNTPQTIVNVAATAEVLATIVNTIGAEQVALDKVTRANIEAAATEDKIHYEALTSPAVGAVAVTKRIWVPDEVFASAENLLTTLVVGDQVFINAYLLAGTVFARAGGSNGSKFARYAAEFMGVEAVHRALALQSLGRLGNDRAFMKFGQKEVSPQLLADEAPHLCTLREVTSEGAIFEIDIKSSRIEDEDYRFLALFHTFLNLLPRLTNNGRIWIGQP